MKNGTLLNTNSGGGGGAYLDGYMSNNMTMMHGAGDKGGARMISKFTNEISYLQN